MYGWAGKVLRVDLSRREVTVEPTNGAWARAFIGGRGLAARYLYEEVDPRVDPLSPENKLILATGPLTGTSASCGARYMAVTKGALTGAITTSNSGGHWGPELKFAGYDMVILEGRAERPVYLWIYDDHVEIRDASHLWGKIVSETEELIKEETGVPGTKVACIGPAGEHLVRFANIMNDKHRAAGRSGVGCVMGSKLVKAVAVRGTGGVQVADPEGFMQAVWSQKQKVKSSPITGGTFPRFGTHGVLMVMNEGGGHPTRNFQEAQFEGAYKISADATKDTHLIRNKACFACTIACGRVTHLPGEHADKYLVTTHPRNWHIAGEGPEYEGAWAMGSVCGVDDIDAVLKGGYLCNDLGMDVVTMGATVAAAMEMFEKGFISENETGMAMPFGSAEALVAMIERTGYGEGFGRELGLGSHLLTTKYGHPELFMGVKGQEFAAHEPRLQGMSLGYATSNRGACHLRSTTSGAEISGRLNPYETQGKAAIVKSNQDNNAVVDASGLCMFVGLGGLTMDDYTPMIRAATGIDYTSESAVSAGERIWNLERLWNLKAGFTAKDDTLPDRILKEAIPKGPTQGLIGKLGEMLPEYYQLRGWSEQGEPTAAKLIELGIL